MFCSQHYFVLALSGKLIFKRELFCVVKTTCGVSESQHLYYIKTRQEKTSELKHLNFKVLLFFLLGPSGICRP